MKKNLSTGRIMRLAMALLLLTIGGISTTLNAQGSDGFFRAGNDDSYSNRDGGMSLGDAVNENPTPLGSGLLIMMAAGAGYSVARRKNISKFTKKSTSLLLALAIVLGMTQCKKSPVTPANNDNVINITLDAGCGDNKTTFDPSTGTFSWLTGSGSSKVEYINVGGSSSGYLGQLNNNDNIGTNTFTGTITTPADGETLYFFYLGNGNHANATTVDFSSQDGSLSNVTKCHIAIGSEKYTGQSSFSARLEMAMAIAYFDLSEFDSGSKTAETVYLSGDKVYNTATINYNDGTITPDGKGYIKVGIASSDMYVALIPSATSEPPYYSTKLNFDSNSKTGNIDFVRGIQKGKYYSNNGSALEVPAETGTGIPGVFSVSSTKQVFFSKGNLQYQASTNTWRFAQNQYDYVGDAENGNVRETIGGEENVKCNNADIKEDYEGWIDLFGWATSGYEAKYPYMKSETSSDYFNNQNMTGIYANYDWGVYNSLSISNGESYNTWRTLTKDEWVYLFNTRSTSTSGLTGTDNATARYTKATVEGVCGVIIFPDVYVQPSEANVSSTTTFNSSYSQYNQFVVNSGWSYMEDAGAVFLPAGGYRNGTTVNAVNSYAYYWSSTKNSNTNSYKLYFYNGGCNPQATSNYPNYTYIYSGHSVRLVRE
jgi:hypothetical protein